MPFARPLLLAALVVVLVAVGSQYYRQVLAQAGQSTPLPEKLPVNVLSKSNGWRYTHTVESRPVYEVAARSVRQIQEPSLMELDEVELKLFHKDGKGFDRITSAKAQFDLATGTMTSPGEVEILLGAEENGKPRARLLTIRSSGVRFDTRAAKATTDQPTRFAFDRGSGTSIGADYNSQTREIVLKRNAELHWHGNGPKERAMVVQAGQATYKENESKVYLGPWAKLQRGTLEMASGAAVVTLENGDIRLVEAQQAQGIDRQPNRAIEYAAAQLNLLFAEEGEVKAIDGVGNARLVSTQATARTTVTSERVRLEFDTPGEGSLLRRADASGKAMVESAPLPRPGQVPTETKVLTSEFVELAMRSGGEEIERLSTHSPGQVEFRPNHPSQRRRTLNGERITLTYSAANQLEKFRAIGHVETRTEGEAVKPGQPAAPPLLTYSQDLEAAFDPQSGALSRLEQWTGFRYQEGASQGRAEKATLEQAANRITLDGQARMWDPQGSTDGHRIILDQKTGDFQAEGDVVSTRVPDPPDPKKQQSGSLLDPKEPVQAKARTMTTRDRQRQVRYEGDAVLWQGANRVQGDRIDIDRVNQRLFAHGSVVSQFVDEPKPPATGSKPALSAPPAPIYTVVRAPQMTYYDAQRLAHYEGGVELRRPGLEVDSRELRAFLSATEAGSSLERAVADGTAKIVQATPDRTRTGTGEHSEYEVAAERVTLQGGEPVLVDSLRGTTKGRIITYFAGNDRLLVDGEPSQPVVSRIQRRITKPKAAAKPATIKPERKSR